MNQLFHLVSNGQRSVITTLPRDLPTTDGQWSPRHDPLMADDWLEAKAAFGFELTPLQVSLRGKSLSERSRLVHSWAWVRSHDRD